MALNGGPYGSLLWAVCGPWAVRCPSPCYTLELSNELLIFKFVRTEEAIRVKTIKLDPGFAFFLARPFDSGQ